MALTINLDAATQKIGLATTSAGCPTVGIAGLTLGGGERLLMTSCGETTETLVRTAYGTHYSRLAEIKKKYDPNNVLRLNQNIRPA